MYASGAILSKGILATRFHMLVLDNVLFVKCFYSEDGLY